MRRGNENKTKQIKIANVRRNLVPIVVQVQGDKQVARALESWLAPCLEEDRIDRKCLGRERSTMKRVEMPLECRSLADLCTRNRRREGRVGGKGGGIRGAGGEGKGGHNAGCFPRMAFTPSPRLSHLLLDHTTS